MKNFFITFFLLISLTTFAQNTIEFNRTITVGTTPSTVPTGTTWEITGVYGVIKDYCTDVKRWIGSPHPDFSYTKVTAAPFIVDGDTLFATMKFNTQIYRNWCQVDDCSTLCRELALQSNGYVGTIIDNLQSFPIWLPAGSVVQSVDGAVNISVKEYTLTPIPTTVIQFVFAAGDNFSDEGIITSFNAGTYYASDANTTDDGNSGAITYQVNGGGFSAFPSTQVLAIGDTIEAQRDSTSAAGWSQIGGQY